jgi:protein-S-isoprenylcysteine O-methyltransferase Ste14
MNSGKKVTMSREEFVTSSFAGILLLFQILSIAFFFNPQLNLILLGIGWTMLIPSFLFLMLPAQTLGLFDSDSTKDDEPLMKSGLYGYVRHPLYIGWIFLSLSLALISQIWLNALLSVLIIPQVVFVMRLEEKRNLEKFSNEYPQYQREVPMVNVFAGIRRKKKHTEKD